jgi:UDP-N-acetylglucosamine acyltransferase
MIHPTAIIHPAAHLDPTVSIGPYAVIDENVVVGPGCRIGPHVHLTGRTTIGANNWFHSGCVIGDAPQDLKYRGEPTRLRIGDDNVFREHVTVHRSTNEAEETKVGARNYLMALSHVGHNVQVGDQVIIANGAMLGGHSVVQDRAFISGNCLVHQWVRVGTLALMQGGSAISKDLPPFCVARGDNGICGLNVVGLRRAGFTSQQRAELQRLYHALFRSGQRLSAALEAAQAEFRGEHTGVLIEFVAASRRGVCRDTGQTTGAESGSAE